MGVQNCKSSVSESSVLQIQLFSKIFPLWNKLPASTAEASDLVLFKQGLSNLTFITLVGPQLLSSYEEGWSCAGGPGALSVNNILFKYKVHRDTTDTSYIQYI